MVSVCTCIHTLSLRTTSMCSVINNKLQSLIKNWQYSIFQKKIIYWWQIMPRLYMCWNKVIQYLPVLSWWKITSTRNRAGVRDSRQVGTEAQTKSIWKRRTHMFRKQWATNWGAYADMFRKQCCSFAPKGSYRVRPGLKTSKEFVLQSSSSGMKYNRFKECLKYC